MQTFTAKINIIGVNPYVDVPEKILKLLQNEAKSQTKPVPVKGTVNGKPFIQTIVKYAGKWRLYLNGPMREATKTGVGDTVTVGLAYDPASRMPPVPAQLKQAFEKNPRAKETFDSLSASRKKEILRYLGFLKTEGKLTKNIDKIIRRLSGDKSLKVVYMR